MAEASTGRREVGVAREAVTLRIDGERKRALDALASDLGRDPADILDEAIAAYLELHAWQVERIREGVRQADAGEFATEEEVAAAFARWRV